MFAHARLRLTLWYMAVLAVVVLLLSLALYDVLVQMQRNEVSTLGPQARHGVARLFARDQRTIAFEIGVIDAGVLVVCAVGAYGLAGRTLRPIQDAMERQQRFSSAASHELRTPLTVLQGTLEVALLRERSPAEYRDILTRSAAEAARMGVLIGNLLSLARMQSDRETLTLEPLALDDVAREAADLLRPLIEGKEQTLEVSLSGPLCVRGDRVKLRQAITNLLDNAVTYTPDGGTIRLVARHDRGHAMLEVRDTGPGIAPEHLPHLFEPFYRVDSARAGDSAHAGLGLALTAWIVRAHGGNIAAASHPGVGSAFTLTLPLDREQKKPALSSPSRPAT